MAIEGIPRHIPLDTRIGTFPTANYADIAEVVEDIRTRLIALGANVARELFVQPSYALCTRLNTLGDHPVVEISLDHDKAYFVFTCPDNFVSLTSVNLVLYPTDIHFSRNSVNSDLGAHGEDYNQHSYSGGWGNFGGVTANKISVNSQPLASTLNSMNKGDVCSIEYDGFINGGYLTYYIFGLLLKYTGEP